LQSGFHVAGISVGVSCGSPAAAEVCQEFYRQLVSQHGLGRRARLLAQSNGGLIAYAWAYRHPDCVDRIAGIYPATDLRRWPGLVNLPVYPLRGLGYNMTIEQLKTRLPDLNPIDNLAPLVKNGVKLLHIHGDTDPLIALEDHTLELFRRYERLGGSHELIVVKGRGHGGAPFAESHRLIEFLFAD
jgi:pimeloyl-ACP methyl ester carboxylesterase